MKTKLAARAVALSVTVLGWVAPAVGQVVKNQGYLPFADAPINYRSENPERSGREASAAARQGEVKLDYEPGHGYLRSVLEALKIPVSSQTLVFSKTSFQYPKISPERPRALYYNDDVYVGQVHDGRLLEFVSFDPMQGAIFYVMDEHQAEHPRFERAELDCVQCHVANSSTRGVPGVMLRSVFTSPSGTQAAGTPAFITGQESPLKDRWGGWYVTGIAWSARLTWATRFFPTARNRSNWTSRPAPISPISREASIPAPIFPSTATSSRIWCWLTRRRCTT